MGMEGNQRQLNIEESFLIPIGTCVELELDGVMAKLKSFCVGALPERLPDFQIPKHNRSWSATNLLF